MKANFVCHKCPVGVNCFPAAVTRTFWLMVILIPLIVCVLPLVATIAYFCIKKAKRAQDAPNEANKLPSQLAAQEMKEVGANLGADPELKAHVA